MKPIFLELRAAAAAAIVLAVVLCGIYPAAVWGLARVLFPEEAGGSPIFRGRDVVGSALIGQPFAAAKYFHGRPSAAGAGYDAADSGGSNLGPLSKKLLDSVDERAKAYRAENGLPAGAPVPAEAVTASASGLDPHISPANALLQAPRVAAARGLPPDEVVRLVRARIEGRALGILGEPRVNVLLLNLDLDRETATR